jgi:sugar lactone lactonase YvrE
MVRGVVVDEDLGAIVGATVSITGYSDVAVTDQKGNFVLPAHAGKGQIVEVHARKGQLTGSLSAPAGKVVEVILSRE